MAETLQQPLDPGASPPRTRKSRRKTETQYAVRLTLSGHVQGVGFRPFVYRLAHELGLNGYVQNRLGEVDIVACGPQSLLKQFRDDLIRRAPPLSRPRIAKILPVDTAAFHDFDIIGSSDKSDARVFIPPDYFMCDDCRDELNDPTDRRYRYPFINCTQCGPRYTLIESLPYDRVNTSMAEFPLCGDCKTEYEDAANRRFHAEPLACPVCGPQLHFVAAPDGPDTRGDAALDAALEQLRGGRIVAVKGIGGYHLVCDASNDDAVILLRQRKQRPSKPLAVMFPVFGEDGLDVVRRYSMPCDCEAQRLVSPARPIVLVTKTSGTDLSPEVAPGLSQIGAFLPYSPLHHVMLQAYDGPLVATSGNVSGEPVITANGDAAARLGTIADAFLHHDRRIVRPADDSVYRRVQGTVRPLRIGRGTAPLELTLPWKLQRPVLAVGGHMKGTVALAWDERVVVSPHIGEMDSPRSLDVFERTAADLQRLYGVTADSIVCDAHPGYTTHRWARSQPLPCATVFHHQAHASALAAEAGRPGRWLVFTWDGVGLGEDSTLWGGEAMLGEPGAWRRVASLRPFRIPGGDRAGREPWRSAAALHWECGQEWEGCPDPQGLAHSAWEKDMNCPQSSAAGRLFDAAAALIAGHTRTSFEAEGPMLLEALCCKRREPVYLSLRPDNAGIWRSDWQPLLALLTDTKRSPALRAEIFHASLALALLQQARRVRDEYSIDYVGLSGGVFQNRFLTEQVIDLLERNKFRVLLAEKLPCNDAAISFGQAAEIAARDQKE